MGPETQQSGARERNHHMIDLEKLASVESNFSAIEAELATCSDPERLIALGREHSRLKPVIESILSCRQIREELQAAEEICGDAEMRSLAEEEVGLLRSRLDVAEQALKRELLPRDEHDDRSAIIEIRSGTGGDEAALFAHLLARLYERYAESKGWSFNVLHASRTMLGGCRELVASIEGNRVFSRLKFESGVHRVQRVPETESSGRIHTSAATVAVLPEAKEIDIVIRPEDLRVDTMRASGAGGQHVNKTDSAVRMTHLPSGIVVLSAQKSQHVNRDAALKMLRAKLFEAERRRADANRAANRRAQVGSGDRSERIRTYNFPQGRVTDHRINLTIYKLQQVLEGDLDEVIDALEIHDQTERMKEQEA